jgi:homoserine O-succinyltransferase/O-acetyltransferase
MNHDCIKVAVLDMYNNEPNEGMRSIKAILDRFNKINNGLLDCKYYDVRGKDEMPDMKDADIVISSGGPGCPIPSGEKWEKDYFQLMDNIVENNNTPGSQKKHVFLICHSFQMMMNHFNYGVIEKRHSPAFGIFPIHKTEDGISSVIIGELPDPFYAVDSREWQVVKPNLEKIAEDGSQLLSLEKERPHVPYERAVMALRFSPYMLGVQFHPEADAEGMYRYFERPDKKKFITEKYGIEKYNEMISYLADPNKIELTHHIIIPSFLVLAVKQLMAVEVRL